MPTSALRLLERGSLVRVVPMPRAGAAGGLECLHPPQRRALLAEELVAQLASRGADDLMEAGAVVDMGEGSVGVVCAQRSTWESD